MKVVEYPEAILRQKAQPIVEITEDLKQCAEEMLKIMREYNGVGLAGPQVGIGYQICVADIPKSKKVKKLVMINPKLLDSTPHKPAIQDEGCLSIPGRQVEKKRAHECRIEYTDLNKNKCKLYLKGRDARVVLHELDHLAGRLIIDP